MDEVISGIQFGATLPIADAEIEAMLKAGVHLGHSKSKNHASMVQFLFGVRNGIAVIDLIKTKEKLAVALVFLKKIAATNGIILLAGTRPAARKFILEVAGKTKMPYFTERWIGGTLTNFKVVSKRVEYMETLEREKATGELAKYTKREQLQKGIELERLRRNFDGLRTLKRLPDAVFIVDTTHDTTAVREARRMGIPIVALVDSNANATQITYPIPANDDALPAVRYMIGRIGQAIEEGIEAAVSLSADKAEKIK
jgi:small subunit ribosomal protein S2